MAAKSILEGVWEGIEIGISEKLELGLLIDRIEKNWSGENSRGKLNWRLRHVYLPDNSVKKKGHSQYAEVPLERAILKAFKWENCLWNQMPVASGLLAEGEERRRSVDLVYQPNVTEKKYEFIELKVLSKIRSHNSPRNAAIELMEYGLLYLFSRKHKAELGYVDDLDGDAYKVLKASHIDLRVVAPPEYFASTRPIGFSVDHVNTAFKRYLNGNEYDGLRMSIGFASMKAKSDDSAADLRWAVANKQPIAPFYIDVLPSSESI